jgi:hypothetical protein
MDEDHVEEHLSHFINYPVIYNNHGHTPLNLAIKKYNKDCIEAMLETLNLSTTHYDYLKHLKPHFIQLLEMKSDVFERFFDHCHTNELKMHVKTSMKLDHGPIYLKSHTQYLGKNFL